MMVVDNDADDDEQLGGLIDAHTSCTTSLAPRLKYGRHDR